MMPASFHRAVAPIVALSITVAACGAGSADDTTVADQALPAANAMAADEMTTMETAAAATDSDRRQRCIDTIRILDRRVEEEGFEYPEEEEELELSEDELELMMAPEVTYVDGVAGPDDRPQLTAMAEFDPETLPIPQLDTYRESCFEQGIVTEAELYPEEFEDGDEDEGD